MSQRTHHWAPQRLPDQERQNVTSDDLTSTVSSSTLVIGKQNKVEAANIRSACWELGMDHSNTWSAITPILTQNARSDIGDTMLLCGLFKWSPQSPDPNSIKALWGCDGVRDSYHGCGATAPIWNKVFEECFQSKCATKIITIIIQFSLFLSFIVLSIVLQGRNWSQYKEI